MTKYLFLVPKYAENINPGENDPWGNYDGWQIATNAGKVVITEITDHFGGNMPVIEAGKIFLDTVAHFDLDEWATEATKDFTDGE